MFIKLNIDVNGTVIEKTFDNLKSLKENYFSMNMAHTILDVVLMDGFESEKFANELFKVVWHDEKTNETRSLVEYNKEEDLLIGLAYICQEYDCMDDFYNAIEDKDDLVCSEYYPNEEEYLEMLSGGKKPAEIIRMTVMGDYRWTDEFVRLDGYANLESVRELPFDSDFSELYVRYFDENEIDDATWTAAVRFVRDGEFLDFKEFEVQALFYDDAYEEAKDQALEYIEDEGELGENVDFTIELTFQG